MKNNEIMISARFESDFVKEEVVFLTLKDISLRALLEAIYYGLNKAEENKNIFLLFREYLMTRKELLVLYSAMGKYEVIDVNEVISDKSVLEMSLDELGFVTSTSLFFTMERNINPVHLFEKEQESYILKEEKSLEYNISTRRLNVIEESVIDIIPPDTMPKKKRVSFLDVIIPTVMSTGGMLLLRYVIMRLSPQSGASNTMILMSAAMGMVSLVLSFYNFIKQKREYNAEVKEWVNNYENYIERKIQTINEWQKSDISYLNSVYPDMGVLFDKTAQIDASIFSRSQNDNDFLRISLGTSDEVKPLFEIKAEKTDNIFYNIYYKKIDNTIKIFLPSAKEERRRKRMTPAQREEEDRNKFLLTELSYNFANKSVDVNDENEIIGFSYLRSDDGRKPPLLLDLQTCGTLGIISNDILTSKNFIKHMVFELSYYHAPEDIQFVFFFDKESSKEKQMATMENYRYLPHCNELFEGVSQFVFDKESSGIVFGKLLSIMNERMQEKEDSENENFVEKSKMTHIICVVFHDYNIKETGFSKYLPEVPKEGMPYVNELGLTFVFLQSVKDKLPKYCGNIIDINSVNIRERKSSKRYNVLTRETLNALSEDGESFDKANDTDKLIEYKHFSNKFIFEQEKFENSYKLAFKQLSAIYYTRIAENGKVPSIVTLFELYGINLEYMKDNEVRKQIFQSWKNCEENDITRNLCVPIGKNEHGLVYLDLHEKADGPHMLVAGTTGSGKSETIITYLIGLCMKYSPMDLNLMLVDMKGGGFSDRLGRLPHCVGVVTDTAGEDEGQAASYMLKRFLESLNAEIKRRKILLSSLAVDNVDAYIRALRIIREIKETPASITNREKIDKLINKLNDRQKELINNKLEEFTPLSHLVLVVDEFTELKRFSKETSDVDFIAEITTIARVGRTLGFHIILVSQNIEGAITDDIRVNSKTRVCLKVATKQASREMLGTSVAAAPTMPLNGRAYLLVGTGSRFEYFQSAYTGANRNLNIAPPVCITKVSNSGVYDEDFYSSKRDNELLKKRNENVNEHDTQLSYVVNTIFDIGEHMVKPKKIFLPPLPKEIYDQTEWRL